MRKNVKVRLKSNGNTRFAALGKSGKKINRTHKDATSEIAFTVTSKRYFMNQIEWTVTKILVRAKTGPAGPAKNSPAGLFLTPIILWYG